MPKKKYKAYWRGYEIFEMEYHNGWSDIIFWVNSYESPITGTGRRRVWNDEIEIREKA